MCGVLNALVDVPPDAGPLSYYPGSHRLPYLPAGDLGLNKVQVQAKLHTQRVFEPYWQQQIEAQRFERSCYWLEKERC